VQVVAKAAAGSAAKPKTDTSYQPVISSISSSSGSDKEEGEEEVGERSVPEAATEAEKAATKAWILQQYGADSGDDEERSQVGAGHSLVGSCIPKCM
jgi:hypothetical protein